MARLHLNFHFTKKLPYVNQGHLMYFDDFLVPGVMKFRVIHVFIEELAILKYKFIHKENTALFGINGKKHHATTRR